MDHERYNAIWKKLRDDLAKEFRKTAADIENGGKAKSPFGDNPHPTVLALRALAQSDPIHSHDLLEHADTVEAAFLVYLEAVCPKNMRLHIEACTQAFDVYARAAVSSPAVH